MLKRDREQMTTAQKRYDLHAVPPTVDPGDGGVIKFAPPPFSSSLTRAVRLQIFKLNRKYRLSLAE